MKTTIEIQQVETVVFQSFEAWVNKGHHISNYDKRLVNTLWLDKEGYAMGMGADFMASRDANRFPVTVHVIKLSRIA